MRRINIFVLLCVLVFSFCGVAGAESANFIKAPLNDHGKQGEQDNNTLVNPSDYNLTTISGGSGTEEDPYVLKFTATDLPAHYNSEHNISYWIGWGIEKNDENTNYQFAWRSNTLTELTPAYPDYSESGKIYNNFYVPSSTTHSHSIGHFVAGSTHYKIDFSGITTQDNDFINLTKSTPTIIAKSGTNTLTTTLGTAVSPHENTITLTGILADTLNVTIPKPSDTVTKAQYVSGIDDPTLTTYQTIRNLNISTEAQADDEGNYTFTVSNLTSETAKGYIAIKYTGNKNSTDGLTDKDRIQFILYRLVFKKPTSNPPAPEDSGSGGGGGSGGGTGTGTETETPTATDQAAEQLVENMDETVANSDAGKAMTEALQSGTQESKEAAVDVVSTLNDTLSTEEIAQLTTEEINSAVTNKTQEKQDAAAEASSGVVSDTTKPAGTDLIAKSETASEALKTANENLSVQPKVVTPTAATPEETEKTAQNLANVNESNLNDKDVDLDTVQAASENLKSAEDIEIDNADNDVALQAQKVEAVFDEVSENLAKAPNAGGGSGVVIASVLSRMRPTSTGFFQIKINLRNLTPGRKLKFWPSVAYFNAYVESRANSNSAQKASLADVSLASSEGDAFFLDADGNPVTKVAGNAANMSVVPYLEGGKDYTTAFITADATESDKAALEALAAQETTTEKSSSSSSSGGCELGLGLGALAAFMAFMKTSKKR